MATDQNSFVYSKITMAIEVGRSREVFVFFPFAATAATAIMRFMLNKYIFVCGNSIESRYYCHLITLFDEKASHILYLSSSSSYHSVFFMCVSVCGSKLSYKIVIIYFGCVDGVLGFVSFQKVHYNV